MCWYLLYVDEFRNCVYAENNSQGADQLKIYWKMASHCRLCSNRNIL